MSIKKKKIGSKAVGMSHRAMTAQQLFSPDRFVTGKEKPIWDIIDVAVRKACNVWWAKKWKKSEEGKLIK